MDHGLGVVCLVEFSEMCMYNMRKTCFAREMQSRSVGVHGVSAA